MNVHCFTQPRTVVCAEDIGLFFGWAHRGYVFNNVLQITDQYPQKYQQETLFFFYYSLSFFLWLSYISLEYALQFQFEDISVLQKAVIFNAKACLQLCGNALHVSARWYPRDLTEIRKEVIFPVRCSKRSLPACNEHSIQLYPTALGWIGECVRGLISIISGQPPQSSCCYMGAKNNPVSLGVKSRLGRAAQDNFRQCQHLGTNL